MADLRTSCAGDHKLNKPAAPAEPTADGKPVTLWRGFHNKQISSSVLTRDLGCRAASGSTPWTSAERTISQSGVLSFMGFGNDYWGSFYRKRFSNCGPSGA
ncbi:hypothetical protein EYF80_039089 [Liparis tanakae]|uniref:Uncharacterized protein n=1 Tax=Liparis tanakae TaxID=230148 RepID=A0A4Z2GBR3_9TELE|nr:hypothetical protein EYF80_039089 [Liparis tanakae]